METTNQMRWVGIVDDDVDVRISLNALVESIGYGARTYETADSLLSSGQICDFACIITDLQMPGTNGLQLAEGLRIAGGPPVILITAFPTPNIERQAKAAGVRCFLRKPFDPGTLIDTLIDILD
jgi:FixJ family two-component response regulator